MYMCICVKFIHVCECVSACLSVYCVRVYVCKSVYVSMSVCICMRVSVYMCVSVYVYTCACVYMYVHAMVGVQRSEKNPRCQSLPFLSFLVKQSQVFWPPRFWRNTVSASRFPQAHWGYRCLRCSLCSYIGSGMGTPGLQARTAWAFSTEPTFLVICYFTLHCLTQHSKLL